MNKKVVIALGGNAILQPSQKGYYHEQLANVEVTCEQIAQLVERGYDVVIVHGNGPQVGNIVTQNELAKKTVPPMPLFLAVSESQGMIGYMIQNRLLRALKDKKIKKEVVTVITQVEVSPEDKAFLNPTKPIGLFCSKEEAKHIMRERKEIWIGDSGRGWRRAVPSPIPKNIIEKNIIKGLVQKGIIVIASGGGGIPVVCLEENTYEGIDAVIDKDLAAERLASELNADLLMILTDVPNVMLNYKQSNEECLADVPLPQIKRYMQDGHFKKGSMEPKVQACIRFVESSGKPAIITSLSQAVEAIEGNAGTIIRHQSNCIII